MPNHTLWTWSKGKVFSKLKNNIFNDDFFDFLVNEKKQLGSFDLVIGNPPFESIGKVAYDDYCNKLNVVDFRFKVEVPRNQLALMFLDASSLLLKDNAALCFIQKSTSLLYNKNPKSQQFKNHIFNTFYVHQIIDFTLLKDVLFKDTQVESAAVFYRKEKLEVYSTTHIVSKLLKTAEDGLFFEFDYYDFYEVSKDRILDHENIWRCNLLGGIRVLDLINKLAQKTQYQTILENYLLNILKINNKRFGVGFQIASQKDEAKFIIDKRILLNENFESNKISFIKYPATQKFHRTRSPELYEQPLITIKKNISDYKIPIAIHNIDTAFDERIVGISVDIEKKETLVALFNKLQKNQKVNIFQTICTCSQFYYRGDNAILKQDIDNWTIPLNGDKIKLSNEEQIILNDALDFIYPSWYLGDDAEINKIIKDKKLLSQYAQTYCNQINTIYKQRGKELQLKNIFDGSAFYACEFYYSNEKIYYETVVSDKIIDKLLREQVGQNKVYNKILRIYKNNDTIILIKPKNLRYWLKSIALRDADDTFDDIIENGMK